MSSSTKRESLCLLCVPTMSELIQAKYSHRVRARGEVGVMAVGPYCWSLMRYRDPASWHHQWCLSRCLRLHHFLLLLFTWSLFQLEASVLSTHPCTLFCQWTLKTRFMSLMTHKPKGSLHITIHRDRIHVGCSGFMILCTIHENFKCSLCPSSFFAESGLKINQSCDDYKIWGSVKD